MRVELTRFDLNLLVAFDTLMTERGVTRAGKVLGITQAAMSNTLRRLREIFDDPLFVKSGYNMEPTARAMELAGSVRQALHFTRLTLEQERFDPQRAHHTFRIGMVEYAAAILLPRLIPLLATTAPGVTVEVVDVGGTEEVAALENGLVDMVFSRFQWVPAKVHLHRLFTMEYVAIYSPERVSFRGPLTLEAFLRARHIHYYPRGMNSTVVDESLAQMGLKRSIATRLFALSPIPCLLAQNDLMAVMPELTARYIAQSVKLKVEALPFKTPKLRLALAWHPRTDSSPAHLWLREQAKTLLHTDGDHSDNEAGQDS